MRWCLPALTGLILMATAGTRSQAEDSPAVPDSSGSVSEPAPLLVPGRANPTDSTEREPPAQARVDFQTARGLEARFPAAAIVTYRKALRLDPHLRDAHYRVGLLFNTRAQWAEAVKEFSAEMQHHPDHLDAARELGLALAREGQHERARKQLEGLARRHPTDGRCWHALAFAHQRAQRPREAEQALRTAIRLPPDDFEEHRDLGALLASLGREPEARAEYRAALRLAPNDPSTWLNLGNIERRAGHRDSALACYRTAVAHDSGFTLAYQGQVQILGELKRTPEVIETYRRWLERKPDEHGARLELVQLLLALKRADEAREVGREGVEANSRSGQAQTIYAMGLAGCGRLREAVAQLRQAQKSFGSSRPDIERAEKMVSALRGVAPDSLRAFFAADSVARVRALARAAGAVRADTTGPGRQP